MNRVFYNEHEEPIVISKSTLDLLLKQEHSTELIALYSITIYALKYYKNVDEAFISGLIGWSIRKVIKYARILSALIQ